jgi:hypothetical protein
MKRPETCEVPGCRKEEYGYVQLAPRDVLMCYEHWSIIVDGTEAEADALEQILWDT